MGGGRRKNVIIFFILSIFDPPLLSRKDGRHWVIPYHTSPSAPLSSHLFPTPGKTRPPLTVAAIPIREAADFPASHPPLWPCATARFASENEISLCWWVGSQTYCSVLPRTRCIHKTPRRWVLEKAYSNRWYTETSLKKSIIEKFSRKRK